MTDETKQPQGQRRIGGLTQEQWEGWFRLAQYTTTPGAFVTCPETITMWDDSSIRALVAAAFSAAPTEADDLIQYTIDALVAVGVTGSPYRALIDNACERLREPTVEPEPRYGEPSPHPFEPGWYGEDVCGHVPIGRFRCARPASDPIHALPCPETDVIESSGMWIPRGCGFKRGHTGPHGMEPLKPVSPAPTPEPRLTEEEMREALSKAKRWLARPVDTYPGSMSESKTLLSRALLQLAAEGGRK